MSGRGKGGAGLGKGGAKRHRKKLRNNIDGIRGPELKRLMRRGGVKRTSKLLFEEVRGVLKVFVSDIVNDSAIYTTHCRRDTVSIRDALAGMRRRGVNVYGAEVPPPSKKISFSHKKKRIIIDDEEEAAGEEEAGEEAEAGEDMPPQLRIKKNKVRDVEEEEEEQDKQTTQSKKKKKLVPDNQQQQQQYVPQRKPWVKADTWLFRIGETEDMSYLRTLLEERQTIDKDDPLPPVAVHNLELLRKSDYNLDKFRQHRKEATLINIRRKSDKSLCGAILFRCHSKIEEVHDSGFRHPMDTRGLTLFTEDRGRPLAPVDYNLNVLDHVNFAIRAMDSRKGIKSCSRIADQRILFGMFNLLEILAIGIDPQDNGKEKLTIESALQLLADEYGFPVNGNMQAFIVLESSNDEQRAIWTAVEGMEPIHLTHPRQAGESSPLWNSQTPFMIDEHTVLFPFNSRDAPKDSGLKGRFMGKAIPKKPVDARCMCE